MKALDHLARIANLLNKLSIEYSLTGDLACILYGVNRATTDIHILLGRVTGESLYRLVTSLRALGYLVSFREAISAMDERGHFTVLAEDGCKVDFKFPSTRVDEESLKRYRLIEVKGVKVRVSLLEENIATKIVALASMKDLEDALKLMRAYRDKIDWGRIRDLVGVDPLKAVDNLLKEFEMEFFDEPSITSRLKELRQILGKLEQGRKTSFST